MPRAPKKIGSEDFNSRNSEPNILQAVEASKIGLTSPSHERNTVKPSLEKKGSTEKPITASNHVQLSFNKSVSKVVANRLIQEGDGKVKHDGEGQGGKNEREEITPRSTPFRSDKDKEEISP